MATRAHSTSAPTSRRRPHPVIASGTPPEAPGLKRADTGQLGLPGPAAMAEQLTVLWKEHATFEADHLRYRLAGAAPAAEAAAIAAGNRFDQALALERAVLAFPPRLAADAIAQLILAHSEIGTLATSDGDHEAAIGALLETATRALATLAKAADFDLAPLSFQYLTEAERMIVCGEVPA